MRISSRYKNTFSPLVVGKGCLLRNRIIAAPITSYADEPSPADKVESIAAKARGGAAVVVIGSVAVNDTDSVIYFKSSSLWGSEKKIFEEEISMIHQYGAKASCELFHGGMFSDCRGKNVNPIGPCTMTRSFQEYAGYERIEPDVVDETHVIGMDQEMMDRVCREYAASAKEAVKMGFDIIMLHFGHGWLMDQFLSPFFNKREDEYGGSLENRIRFPRRVVEAVRKAVGPNVPIDMRIGASERVAESVSLEDITAFICEVEPLIDMVHISSGLDKLVGATSWIEAPSLHPHGMNVAYAAHIKQAVDHIPVAVVGSITTPDEAEKIIAEGKADLVALGRPLVADAEWVNKARDNRPEDIRTCLRCDSCYGVATFGCSQGCAVNPRYERELRLQAEERMLEKRIRDDQAREKATCESPTQRTVLVIGGGPAGMNAAIAAHDRGHHVILLEKENELGGLLKISKNDSTKIDMHNHMAYLITQVNKRDIDLRLGVKATPELAASLNPDEIIVALGSYPRTYTIPGADQEFVYDIVSAHRADLGEKVVIIGAGPSGCELALEALRNGKTVTLIELTDKIGAAGNLLYRGALQEQFALYQDRLTILTNTETLRIEDHCVIAKSNIVPSSDKQFEKTKGRQDNQEIVIPADNVVYCIGMIPRREEALTFMGLTYDVRIIGDCLSPRRINEATHEGYFAGAFI